MPVFFQKLYFCRKGYFANLLYDVPKCEISRVYKTFEMRVKSDSRSTFYGLYPQQQMGGFWLAVN